MEYLEEILDKADEIQNEKRDFINQIIEKNPSLSYDAVQQIYWHLKFSELNKEIFTLKNELNDLKKIIAERKTSGFNEYR